MQHKEFSPDTPKTVHEVHGLSKTPVIFHHSVVKARRCHVANWHENVELLLFLDGEGTLICEDEQTPMRAGDIGVIDSHMLHRVVTDNTVVYYCLIVDETFCRKNGLAPAAASFPRRIRSAELTEEYHKIAQAFAADDPYREPRLRAAVLSLMVALMSGYATPAARGSDAGAPIRTAVGYINSHYAEPMELDTLAATAQLSKYHFLREFKAATGQTPIAYINTVRVKQAERLLREGNVAVAQVAEACGFSNHSYFSKVFLRHKGVLPSAFAAACRAERDKR